MKSVTDQIFGDGALDKIVEEGITTRDADIVKPEPLIPLPTAEDFAQRKLRMAFAARDGQHAPKSTGVKFVSGGRTATGTPDPLRMQVQEIFDDGSVRNPYAINRKMSGRQRRNLRKQTNRTMRGRGIQHVNIADVLKGRRSGPQEGTVPTPEPLTQAGTPVADILGD